MISYLINKIFRKKQNNFLSELKTALKHYSSISKDFNKHKIYFLGSFVYNQNEYSEVKAKIESKEMYNKVVEKLSKDLKQDNVTFFLLCNNQKKLLISLFDPYDYLQKSKVLDIWQIEYDLIKGEQIQ